MKAPQRAGGRTDQMLGAMADILTSMALPSQQWLPDLCAEGPGDEMRPEHGSAEVPEGHGEQRDGDPQSGAAAPGPPEPHSTEQAPDTCPSEESYSVAGNESSISASVASIPPQPSTSSGPSSPGSRRSVSTLKKWLTNPVRKLSTGSLTKGERPGWKLEGRPRRGGEGRRHGRQEERKSIDLGLLGKADEPLREPKGTESGLSGDERLPALALLSRLLEGGGAEVVHAQLCLSPPWQGPSPPGDPQVLALPEELPGHPPTETTSEEEQKSALEKSMFVLAELIETEKMYVEDLGQIVEGYMATMRARGIPEEMRGKDKIIFGNIHQIYDWHKDYFLKELEKCLHQPDLLAQLFIKHERRLHMYVVYCQNKPKSEHVVSEYIDSYFEELKQELGHRLQLNDLLIKPVQRIMKYQLLLKDFLKYYSKARRDTEQLERAVQVMCFVPKRCNDMMNVGRLQGFEGKLTAQGKLLQQDTFWVTEQDGGFLPRCRERRVFLFEQLVILSEPLERRKAFAPPAYLFKSSIKVSCLGLEEAVENDPCKFALTSREADRSSVRYVLQAAAPEIAQAWAADVSHILETQRNFLNALQSPIEYQRRESKSHSLGWAGTARASLPSGPLRPRSSASMDQNQGPGLGACNASLPALYPPGSLARPERLPPTEPTRSQRSPVPETASTAHICLDFPGDPQPGERPPGAVGGAGCPPPEPGSTAPCAQLAKLDEDELAAPSPPPESEAPLRGVGSAAVGSAKHRGLPDTDLLRAMPCRCSSSERVKLLPQYSQVQTKGRSPACHRSMSRPFTEQRFQQLYGAPEPRGRPAGALRRRLARGCRCSGAAALRLLRDRLPIAAWLPGYRLRSWLLGDALAGLTVGIVHIPQGMAFALLAAVAPVYGLYTSFFPVILYGLFGTGRHVSTGTFAVVSLMTGSVVEQLVPWSLEPNATGPELARLEEQRIGVAAAMAFLVGLLLLVMFVVQLGFLSTYLSEPIIKAFTNGAALHVLVSQLQNLLGLPLARGTGCFTIFKTLASVVEALPLTNVAELLISASCLAVLVPVKEINTRFRSKLSVPIPGEILVVLGATGICFASSLDARYGVQIVGRLPAGFPQPRLPALHSLPQVLGDTVAIAFVAYAVSVSLAIIYAEKHRYAIDPNQELLAHGISNLLSSLLTCFPSSATLATTNILESAGGHTQLAGFFSSAVVLVVLVWLGPLFYYLPKAVLACINVTSLRQMVLQFWDLPELWRISRIDFVSSCALPPRWPPGAGSGFFCRRHPCHFSPGQGVGIAPALFRA
ncbi:rho guanine nucleotide exchange factor 25 [Emydura macquarii macquarii]|uniref:rho guanine nucleotide exchange factor 25 n=1 Tax=Emydura macquarii macquarii TaxID=1129001 RepID=UPI00352AB729